MIRWLMLLMIVLGLVIAFVTKSPGMLGAGLLIILIGIIGFVFALAADRVSANARPESSMAAVEDLAALRKRALPRERTEHASVTKVFSAGERDRAV